MAVLSFLFPDYHELSVRLELVPINNAIVFSQYWPISYQISYPSLIDQKFELSCDPLGNSTLCTPFLTVTNALNNFTTELQNLHFFYNEQDISTRSGRSLLSFFGDIMYYITGRATDSQLESFRVNFKEITRHIQNLELYNHGIHTTLSKYTRAITRLADESKLAFTDVHNAINNILQRENSIFSTLIRNMKSFITFLLQLDAHLVSNIHNFLLHYRYHEAYACCNQNKLPRSLVTPQILDKELSLLKIKLRNKNLTVAPTFTQQHAYEFPITSCAYSASDILVHIKIPLIDQSTPTAFYELLAFPLAAENETCSFQLNTTHAIMTSTTVFPIKQSDFR